jgi:adenylate cyclase
MAGRARDAALARALDACFEGVVPSIVCTLAPDGTPNISYLSHVARLGGRAGRALEPVLLQDRGQPAREPARRAAGGGPGRRAQYRLDLLYRGSVEDGPAFDRMAADLRATSAQLGMADVMRLRAVDVFDVLEVREVRGGRAAAAPGAPRGQGLRARARRDRGAGARDGAGRPGRRRLDALAAAFGHEATLVLLHDAARGLASSPSAAAATGRAGSAPRCRSARA